MHSPLPHCGPGHIQPIQHCNLSSNFLKGNLLLRVIKNVRLKIADAEKMVSGYYLLFILQRWMCALSEKRICLIVRNET